MSSTRVKNGTNIDVAFSKARRFGASAERLPQIGVGLKIDDQLSVCSPDLTVRLTLRYEASVTGPYYVTNMT
jgi:hypothetical protein